MGFLDVRAVCGVRAQAFELLTNEAVIGQDEGCDLQILESSLAPSHARLLVRRGRVILAPAPGCVKGIRVADNISRSPIVLKEDDSFELGRVTFVARYTEAQSLLGQKIGDYRVIRSIDSEAFCVRRYLGVNDQDEFAEIAVVEPEVDATSATRWLERVQESESSDGFLRPIVASGYFRDRPFCMERVGAGEAPSELGRGLRLSQVERVVYTKVLCLPVEAIVAVLAQVAEALSRLHRSWGPHGALQPRMIHLREDGAVHLIRPGPIVQDYREELQPLRSQAASFESSPVASSQRESAVNQNYGQSLTTSFFAPERRFGGEASVHADIWALGVLARHLLGRRPRNDWPATLDEILAPARNATPQMRGMSAEELGVRLKNEAHRLGLDPSVSHISRLVRLLMKDLSKPLGFSKWTKRAKLDATRSRNA